MTEKSAIQSLKRWNWLFAPSIPDLVFSLRTTITSLVALSIALWMELGQPQWAAMTVWIVAQNTIGESLSKAHWRVVGTLAGAVAAIMLVAASPQQPWLFFPLLAGWIGLCAGLGTLCHNYHSYTFVLMGFTCAIISVSAIDTPDQVFSIAVARSTYILLGVVCEMTVALICEPNVASRARAAVRHNLQDIIEGTASVVRDVLISHAPPERDLYNTFSRVMTLNDRIEFSAIETGHSGPMVASARATLGQAAKFMSRGLGMQTRLALSGQKNGRFAQPVVAAFADFLAAMPRFLDSDAGVTQLCTHADTLLRTCETSIEQTARLENGSSEQRAFVDDRIVLQGIALLLSELTLLLNCFRGTGPDKQALGALRLVRPAHGRAALSNGLRSFIAVLIAALIWEITAWPTGTLFVMFVSVICARFASFSNTVIASKNFFLGAVWAVIAAVIPVFLVMPVTSDYPVLCFAAGIPMIIGGLVNRHPATAAMGASFVNFFPYMLEPENHFRINELQWFNSSMALLTGLGFGVLIFRYLFPFSFVRFHRNFRAIIENGLRNIVGRNSRMTDQLWLGEIIEEMERLIAHDAGRDPSQTDAWLSSAFSVMTVGRNLLYVKFLLTKRALPPSVETELTRLFEILESTAVTSHEKLEAITGAESALYQTEARSEEIGQRIQISDVIGCLSIAVKELGKKHQFSETA
ncbi:FUSC family protein [Acetobacter fallax]|uniref:FUSC family protein n=1 Tax=Acetobacter fallax TaxID=1737473 RepID=A0ABX0KFL6_9PROT|nr:FUSC family protein [Acetobacter fallax]NHO37324.1 FUSC family protein [Acetobacter fallax]